MYIKIIVCIYPGLQFIFSKIQAKLTFWCKRGLFLSEVFTVRFCFPRHVAHFLFQKKNFALPYEL